MDAGNDEREQAVLVAAKWLSWVGLNLLGISWAACHHNEANSGGDCRFVGHWGFLSSH